MAVVNMRAATEKDTNFETKSARKAKRKGMVRRALNVRGAISNAISEAKLERRKRIEFYRKVRLMKDRRRRIAANLASLVTLVDGMEREVVQVGDRIAGVDGSYLGEAYGKTKEARGSLAAYAEDWHAFSRARIYYYRDGKPEAA
jgi:hypothetical protein